jgi:hypothetical protein
MMRAMSAAGGVAVLISVTASATAHEHTAYPAAAYPQAKQPSSAWFEPERGFSVKIDSGATYRKIYRVDAGAAHVNLAFGGQTGVGSWYGHIHGGFGQTDQGLLTRELGFGPSWEAPIGRWRFGVGARVAWLAIKRSSSGGRLEDITLGGRIFSTIDVYRAKTYATTLGLGFETAMLDDRDPPQLQSVAASIGLRFF